MKRHVLILGLVVAAVCIGFASRPMTAQQFPISPTAKPSARELVVPPGIYQTLVFAADGSGDTVAKAVLKTPSGELTVTANAGQTVVIPLGSFSLSQQATITITDSTGATMLVSAITTAGPVNFEPAKKK